MQQFRWTMNGSLTVAMLVALAGCNSDDTDYKKPAGDSGPVKEVHGTHKPGPHGGKLLDLGDHEFMAEVVFKEDDPKTITVYLIDHNDNSKAVFTGDQELKINGLKVGDSEVSLTLASKPQEGDPEGKTSRFEVSGESIPAEIEDMHELENGQFTVTINDIPYSGTIEHDDHDEDHEHHKDHDDEDHHKKGHDDDKDHEKK